jgi:hypothetical protein
MYVAPILVKPNGLVFLFGKRQLRDLLLQLFLVKLAPEHVVTFVTQPQRCSVIAVAALRYAHSGNGTGSSRCCIRAYAL